MRMYDIIHEKRAGKELSCEEIEFFINGFNDGSIPDYQMSALTMAICLNGMSIRETKDLTMAMANSGSTVDLSVLGTSTADKHSTGGVGDKTTLIVAPIAASLGCKIAKMSGRGLGHTGGTIDKLESIPGYRTNLTNNEFISQVERTGIAVVGQTENLAPADKKLYALRDVTATVDSIPLIASSVMSKKIAAGSHSIVLDVKCGSGAFMKSLDEATELARRMVDIGTGCGRRVGAIISNMDVPLGCAVGNSLEVREAIEVLSGEKTDDLYTLCIELAAAMHSLAFGTTHDESVSEAKKSISDGRAIEKFRQWITAQGGDAKIIEHPELMGRAKVIREVLSGKSGYISGMDSEIIGNTASVLGAGRIRKEDSIDHTAGLNICAKVGDYVNKGEPVAKIFTSSDSLADAGEKMYLSSLEYSASVPSVKPLIYAKIGL